MIESRYKKEARSILFKFLVPLALFYWAIGSYFQWDWEKLSNFGGYISGLVTAIGLIVILWQLVFQLGEIKEKLDQQKK